MHMARCISLCVFPLCLQSIDHQVEEPNLEPILESHPFHDGFKAWSDSFLKISNLEVYCVMARFTSLFTFLTSYDVHLLKPNSKNYQCLM